MLGNLQVHAELSVLSVFCLRSSEWTTFLKLHHYFLMTSSAIHTDCVSDKSFYSPKRFFFHTGNWILERSTDGVTFEPWQYYAITDTECLTRFNIAPRTGPPSYTRDDEVICTSFYSKIPPLENGEVAVVTSVFHSLI